MPDIDPARAPLSSDDLADDAAALGVDAEAAPLVEAQDPPTAGTDRVEGDITLLPPG